MTCECKTRIAELEEIAKDIRSSHNDLKESISTVENLLDTVVKQLSTLEEYTEIFK